jgi:hypothetical protein
MQISVGGSFSDQACIGASVVVGFIERWGPIYPLYTR